MSVGRRGGGAVSKAPSPKLSTLTRNLDPTPEILGCTWRATPGALLDFTDEGFEIEISGKEFYYTASF